MAEVRVVALIKAKAGHEQTVSEALKHLADASQNEEGCQSYELFRSNVEPATFATVESWNSQEALEVHNTGPHPAAALEAAGHLLQSPPEIHPLSPL